MNSQTKCPIEVDAVTYLELLTSIAFLTHKVEVLEEKINTYLSNINKDTQTKGNNND